MDFKENFMRNYISFQEVSQKEYMSFVGNLICSGKYSLVNKSISLWQGHS